MQRIVLAILTAVVFFIGPCDAARAEGPKGWYLLEPPVDEISDSRFRVRDQAPLTQWTRIATYDTEAACEARRNEAIAATRDELLRLSKTSPLPRTPESPFGIRMETYKGLIRERQLADATDCVHANDPRLRSESAR